MFCAKCGNKIAESGGFCHKCGAKLMANEATQQTPTEPTPAVKSATPPSGIPPTASQSNNNVSPGTDIKSIMGLTPFLKFLGITRLVVALAWTLVVISQWIAGMGTSLIIWNVISFAIQIFIAMTLLGVGFARLNEIALRFGSINEYIYRSHIRARRNDFFAGLAVLWYGYQAFWLGYNFMSVFLGIEIIILVISLITMRMIERKMPKPADTPESEAIKREEADAQAISKAYILLKGGVSNGPNINAFTFAKDMPVCFISNDLSYSLTVKDGHYKVTVNYVGNTPGNSVAKMGHEQLREVTKPAMDWIYSVLCVQPELAALSSEELKTIIEASKKADASMGKMIIGLGVTFFVIGIAFLALAFFEQGGFYDFDGWITVGLSGIIFGSVLSFLGYKKTSNKK